ncbi:MAG TPA: tetratricopeptide repeat protein, partial [Rhodocyclaceae bacterium]|nr:tetratricopeptide repeat protein [Rhodocyclaceae bacterium]
MIGQSIFRTTTQFIAVAALFATCLSPASAASLQDAQNLLKQGQNTQALEEVDKLLVANPQDRSAHFLKGVILTEMNRLDEAIVVFTALTQEAP